MFDFQLPKARRSEKDQERKSLLRVLHNQERFRKWFGFFCNLLYHKGLRVKCLSDKMLIFSQDLSSFIRFYQNLAPQMLPYYSRE